MIQPDDILLFQGDSITDAGRDRAATAPNDPRGLGQGYVRDVAATLLAQHGPAHLRIHNRGVSGDRVHELATRWKPDCLDLQPTVLSVMIGINDLWHGFNEPARGVSPKMFAAELRRLLSDAHAKLTGPRGLRMIVLAEPFILPCGAGAQLPFEPELSARRALIQEIAEGLRNQLPVACVAYQQAFNAALDRGIDPEHLAPDGIHPTFAGHMLMAQTWLDAVQNAP